MTATVRGRSRSRSRRRLLPRPRVMVGVIVLSMFVGVLLVQTYINSEFAGDHKITEVGDQSEVPRQILRGGPIINTTGGQQSSSRLPARTIALTFDDGPDPKWTPEVLKVLRENDAHGTFFVIGSQVIRYGDMTKKIVQDGNELGLHTFTHPNLQNIAEWRREMELSQTQTAIARAVGVHTNLARFPYSSEAAAIDNTNWKLVQEAGRQGYLIVVNDLDSEDWQRPGIDTIIRNATPTGSESAVVLFHDAGGNRAETVAALGRFIPMMKARGYRFTTVSDGLNLQIKEQAAAAARLERAGVGGTVPVVPPPLVVNGAAARSDVLRGGALLWTVRSANGMIWILAGLFLVVGLLTIARTGMLLLLASRHARQRRRRGWSWGPPVTEPVSVIVPAYNEKAGIEAAVKSLALGDYPKIEVVVVDDGSTDGTAVVVEQLGLPDVRVVRVPNGGKASALNTGIALAKHDIIITVDGDTIFERDSVRMLVQPFASPAVGAVAGNVKVGNRRSLVATWQHIEYVIGFNLDRRLYEVLRCMPTVPGAIGAFRRAALAQVGGISDETLAEDTDVTMALCRAGWRIVYEERAKAWTEAPATLEQLYRQRYRWSYGTMQAMWKHRNALTDRGESGRFGRVGLPFLALFGVALPLFAPVVDLMLVYGLFFWELRATLIAYAGMLALQLFTAGVAFRFDRESMRPLWRLPLQQFAYRQLMYLVLIQSVTTALTGGRLRWHKLHRAGLNGSSPEVRMPVPARNVPDRGTPGENIAPPVDTWPPVREYPAPPRHAATGRATARPVVPSQPLHLEPEEQFRFDPEDMPSAGSPPGGGTGPVYTG
jgi:cellulose synthase/poly-beta-1,6-N-acetylglucosamine synthase-like glycosyltransferase/peptidoglycan/xylan/chitin deacetylase (PgdA/CDA1 family)